MESRGQTAGRGVLKLSSIRFPRAARALPVSALLLLLALQLVHVARVYSANWDEAHHLYDGYRIWAKHDYRANAEVPPLVKLTAALPLLPLHPQLPEHASGSQTKDAFLDGRTFVFGNGGDRLLFPARMGCMLFTLGTAWLIYAAGRSMFGTLPALLGLGLFVFDPNVLAHGALVSTDLGSACFLFAACFAFYRYTREPTPARLALAGLATGLAMAAKFTGVLAAPVLVLLAAGEAARCRSPRLLARGLAACAGILFCAWVAIWAFYGFRYAPAPHGLELSPRLAPYLASLPGRSGAAALGFAARFHLLPEAYLWGLANTEHTEWEYTSYFFGKVFRHGPWQYFPAAFLIKSTLPLLLLLAVGTALWLRARARHGRELLFLLLPPCVYFTVVSTSHFNIGARHLLPIYPFLYVLAGATGAALVRRGRVGTAVLGALLLWQLVTSVRVAPAYMAYGNEAWGGPLEVRRYLSDSNVDWGQQLKAVKTYLDSNHIGSCWFAYFPDGAVQPGDYGVQCRRLPTPSGLWWFHLPTSVPPVIDGTVLISESDLDGVESGDGPLNPYGQFRAQKPVAILQDGVYVYQGRFAVPLAAAWVLVRKSEELAEAGQKTAALKAAVTAVQLAPGSARAQLSLAEQLAGAGQWNGALAHYRAAQRALAAGRPDLEREELGPPIEQGLREAEQRQ